MQTTLLFLPDISGFTSFVQNTEINHSQHIISELLELLIDQNAIDLRLAEIEGDALFFFRTGDLPDFEAMQKQIRRMYVAFHNHLRRYDTHRICQCGACATAASLKLKFFLHCGHTNTIKVKNQEKPFGEPVIQAHRLMKNSIPVDEYILMTEQFAADVGIDLETDADSWHRTSDTYDGVEVGYAYLDISDWRAEVEDVDEIVGDADQPIWQHEYVVNLARLQFFELLSNLKYRILWNQVDKIEYDDSVINQAGEKHICVIKNKQIEFQAIKREFDTDAWVMGERMAGIPGYKYLEMYYLVYENGDGRTRVDFRAFGKPGRMAFLLRPMVKRVGKKNFSQALDLLKQAAEQEPAPVE